MGFCSWREWFVLFRKDMQRIRSRGGRSQVLSWEALLIFFFFFCPNTTIPIRTNARILLPKRHSKTFLWSGRFPLPFFLSMLLAAYVGLFLLASTSFLLSAPPIAAENFRPAAEEYQKLNSVKAYLENINKTPVKIIQACFCPPCFWFL